MSSSLLFSLSSVYLSIIGLQGGRHIFIMHLEHCSCLLLQPSFDETFSHQRLFRLQLNLIMCSKTSESFFWEKGVAGLKTSALLPHAPSQACATHLRSPKLCISSVTSAMVFASKPCTFCSPHIHELCCNSDRILLPVCSHSHPLMILFLQNVISGLIKVV